ncbi:MAG TPA: ROK family protein, partial [Chloroflexota bacterium]|nr:ROK family protein [Chloroflexota bacterium]
TLLINRGKAAAVGEAWSGAARDVDSSVCLYVSTGISAGIVIGRELYRGRSMSEGEIGHTTVLPDGPLCVCGNRGCLLTMAASPAILSHVRECLRATLPTLHQALLDDQPDGLTLEAIGAAAAAGNAAVLEALDGVAKYLGIAVANLVDILDPEMVVLGGPAILALPMLVPRIEAVVRRRAVWVSAPSVEILASQLGRDAVAIGAAAYLLSHSSIVTPTSEYSFAPTPSPLPPPSAAPTMSAAEPLLLSTGLAGEAVR